MRLFKTILSDNWRHTAMGYVNAVDHLTAINTVDKNVKRVTNARFREIETTGKYYYVTDLSKNGKTFIFEIVTIAT